MGRRRRSDDAIGALLAEWGALTHLEQQGRAVEWPGHQLPLVLAIMKMPPGLRRALETRYGQPGLSPFDRPQAAGLATRDTTPRSAQRVHISRAT